MKLIVLLLLSALTAGTSGTYNLRLRKLHLFRPDLIFYPLYMETVC